MAEDVFHVVNVMGLGSGNQQRVTGQALLNVAGYVGSILKHENRTGYEQISKTKYGKSYAGGKLGANPFTP